ncbi:YSIRK-type signal peptide-containing protein [Staphylococcus saccharolyticus]|nr:YSIRK-type signal peptide-containing protein [Staphylococcus saccharolyticus]MBL7572971.1 YSIRK-type signal peptide-containing protein [Staphylococcus saccharolyticus]MBL7584095.1 YSIRK-type signal peptide-containing protein [Staphylococcus saccharolyticus]MBL7638586.1 YSIRK-type signal peptide-containing protein [Staphylococcus saccharolyticus]QRJ67917.1 YSIRK-type signal peptide-containing protein [Staphylococcus saccharolyticus]
MNQHQKTKYVLHRNFFSIRKLKFGETSVT